MGEVAVSIFKSIVKVGALVAVISGLIVMLTVIVSGINVLLNKTVIMDLLSMVQVWAPFNLDPIILWLGTSVSLFMVYRMSLTAYAMINSVMGK